MGVAIWRSPPLFFVRTSDCGVSGALRYASGIDCLDAAVLPALDARRLALRDRRARADIPDVIGLLLGLLVAGGILLLTVVLPILSFLRAREAQQTADGLRARVSELEGAVERLGVAVLGESASRPEAAAPGPATTPPDQAVPEPSIAVPAATSHVAPASRAAGIPEPEAPVAPAPAAALPRTHAHEDLEQRIGSRWLLYAGIAAVVLGMSYFVKFAFDNGWISEPLRVAAGVAVGLALIAAGWRFSSRGVPRFGQALAGCGILVLYVSIYAALHFYRLVSEAPAFALMVLVTAAAAWLADRLRSQVLAVLALLGGFATPLLVGGERDAQVVLFTYTAILVAGSAALARRHTWPLLTAGSYLGTFLLVTAWFFESYEASRWLRTEAFLTLYVAMFAFMLWTLLASKDRSLEAVFAIALLATAPLAYHVTSVALLIGHPAAWLVYVVLITVAGLAVAERTAAAWLRVVVLLLVGLPAFAWLVGLQQPGWHAAGVGTMVALYALHLAAQWEATPDAEAGTELDTAQALHTQLNGLLLPFALYWFFDAHAAAWSAWVVAGLAAWNSGLAVVARSRAPRMGLQFIVLAATLTAAAIVVAFDGPAVPAGWAVEGVFLGWLAMRERSRVLGWGSGTLVLLGSLLIMAELAEPLPTGEAVLLNPRALAAAIVLGLLAWLAWRMRSDPVGEVRSGARDAVIVIANLLAVIFLSAEIRALHDVRPVGGGADSLAEHLTLSVSWALYAVVLVAVGIQRQYAPARYFAIALFGITVAKVLFNDIAGLDRFYRMLTVLGVGVLLLVASYLYQRRGVARDG